MKNGLTGFVKFAVGTAFGATLGATIGALMAPKSGAETQADTAAFLSTAKSEGERARKEAEAQVSERFRQKVGDSSALSSKA